MSNEDDQQLISNNVFNNAEDLNDALTEESDNNDVSSPYQSRTWTPNVGDMFKPIVGTKFGNLKDAFEGYKKYSKAAGFDVRKSTQRTDRKGIVLRKFFVCSKEDKQRYTQRLLDHETRTTTPMMETPLLIERHAAKVYTREIFYVVQQEIIASLWTCSALSKDIIQDRDKERKGEFKVLFDEKDHIITCTCLHFELYGILCRHAFYVLRHHEIKKIPKRYILQRWRKDAVKLPSTKAMLNGTSDTNNTLSDIYSSVGRVTSCLGNDIEKLGQFLECIKLFENELESNSISESSRSKKDTIDSFIGITQPAEITIKVPKNARNKGCGTSKRYVGAREESINKSSRGKRICRNCQQWANHDSRNCPKKKE
ncbi:FAR1 DNA binding domain-containing protein [Cynara cardunculus var. scolymus]|uniref:FAR1 DNA binding domain-containing protein n=1 Tax=Cynara cardunculus var. scolymus TaxID=59895 RepID=A0A118K417_CYNCS|nr:FAR1 DNA binding domain-containing protein [Cynara cardunculus var. scolymus]